MAVFLAYVRLTYTSHSAQLPVFYLQQSNLALIDLSVAKI
jgi:hypothetical protein